LSEREGSRVISMTLRAGVGVSAALLVAGLLTGGATSAPAIITPAAIGDIPSEIATFHGAAMLHLGLLLLMLTPIARVIVVVANFTKRKELSFAMISIGVLLLLITTVITGLWGVMQ
jgi:uncharacterized membrane protein